MFNIFLLSHLQLLDRKSHVTVQGSLKSVILAPNSQQLPVPALKAGLV